MKGLASMSSRGQIAAIRSALVDVLNRYQMGAEPLKLVLHAYNTTFRLQRYGGDIALRVNVNSTRSLEEIRGELAWTAALAHERTVLAPHPVALFNGSPMTTLNLPGIERDVAVLAYSWLPGRHVSKARPLNAAYRLGELMSNLHEMTSHWRLPAGASRPVLHNVIDELPWRLPDKGPFRQVYDSANQILEKLSATPKQLVHFDLHFGNVKMHTGRMSVFDFDDCLFSHPVVDAAQAMFYLRRGGPNDPLETAFWNGAGTTVEQMGLSRSDFEMLIGGRGVLLATDLAGNMSAGLQAIAPRYIEVTEKRLHHLLDTGEFDSSVARMSD